MQGVLLSREWQQTADELVTSLAAAVVSWVPVSDPQHPQVLDKDLHLKRGNLENLQFADLLEMVLILKTAGILFIYVNGIISVLIPLRQKFPLRYCPHMVCLMVTQGWADKAIFSPIGSRK